MTAAETREVALFALVALLLLLMLLLALRRREPAIPPVVAPVSMPVEDQVRDVRHRVANVELHIPVLQEHVARLRGLEREFLETKGKLDNLAAGQTRIERNVDMLVTHLFNREGKE